MPWDDGLKANPFRDCPIFGGFINWAVRGQQDVLDYLQRVFGYALTGQYDEHALFFFHGPGSNGKSVLIDLFRETLGEYSGVADRRVFSAARPGFERHSTEVHALRGKRMASVAEGQEDQQWDAALVKGPTGGDAVTARAIARDPESFAPTFKIFFASNHTPNLGSVGEAWRRRIHLIEFTARLSGQPDTTLASRMKSEREAILRWAIMGCLEWQRIGLAPPKSVVDASAQYLAQEDMVGRWIGECCECDPSYREEAYRLWQSWDTWRKKNGEPGRTQSNLTKALLLRGHKQLAKHPVRRSAMIGGIKVR